MWGEVELEPEVEDWLRALPDEEFGRVALYVDLLGEGAPRSATRIRASSMASCVNCVSG